MTFQFAFARDGVQDAWVLFVAVDIMQYQQGRWLILRLIAPLSMDEQGIGMVFATKPTNKWPITGAKIEAKVTL